MTNQFAPARVVDLLKAQIESQLLPAEQVTQGQPETGFVELGTFSGTELGVWEHTPGVSTDVETDELFIVLSGKATIDFVDSDDPSIVVNAGSLVQLTNGMRTRWNVTETLRKVYLVSTETK